MLNTNQCPKCGASNALQAKFCSKCGHNLPSRPVVPPAQPGSCPQCGVPLRPNAHFCPSCGYNTANLASGSPWPAGAIPPAGPGQAETRLISAVPGAPTLVVRWPGGNTQKHPLTAPRLQLGRAPDNDIVVSYPVVSAHHLCLEQRAGQVMVTDLNSTNGTQINGQRIPANAAHPLNVGDVLRIGDATGNSISMLLEGETGEALRTLALGRLDLTTQSNISIGRDPNSYLPLNHPTVSFRHALITRQNGGLVIRDMGSTNGTFVNGTRISQVPLSSGDVIQIGPFKLVYDAQQQSLAQSMGLGHRLDAVQLGREVTNKKMILNNVNMTIQAGDFVALVGGSGAGKSTLMKALNGYEPANHGQMLLDGEPLYPKLDLYRTQMGYVPQDDIIHRELPVKLALWYAARLRLPDASPAEIDTRIQEALRSVDMVEHAEKPVRILSGGQRKRVSIAVELLAKPSLFFLDEPTSGLDPGLEKKMMYDLNHLADEGRTIVLVTHATANIQQCDFVAFMTWGRLAYYGPPKDAINFFNVQDFSDIYLKLSEVIDPARGKQPSAELAPYYPQYQASGKVSAGLLWADYFQRSNFYQKYIADRQRPVGAAGQPGSTPVARPPKPARDSFFRQAWILARRQFDLIRHDVRTLVILLVMMPFIGLMFMAVSEKEDLTGRLDDDNNVIPIATIESDLRAQALAEYEAYPDDQDLDDEERDWSADYKPYARAKMLLVMIGLALTQGGTFGAAYEIVKERAIFKRERAVNLSVIAYVFSKMMVLLIFGLIQVVSVVLLISLRVKLGFDPIVLPNGMLEMMVTLYLAVLASIAFGLFLSAIVPNTDVVLYAILAQLFIQIILSGTLFPLPSNPASMATPGYWTMKAMASSVDLPRLDEEATVCSAYKQPAIPPETTEKIDTQCNSAAAKEENLKEFSHEEEYLYKAWGALGAHMVFWLALTIVVQARKKIE